MHLPFVHKAANGQALMDWPRQRQPLKALGASNFFELAVATAIVLFGFNSGAALATVVGVLVEVPVMLSVVSITRRTKAWYERGVRARASQ